ncbi:hypothetical protein ACJMK2_022631, partial [Sinanodonta woodiana]
KSSTTLIHCVLYYSGNVFSDDCSTRRRAICVRDEFQKYAVSKLDEGLPRYAQQPLSTTGASSTIIDTTSYSFEIAVLSKNYGIMGLTDDASISHNLTFC